MLHERGADAIRLFLITHFVLLPLHCLTEFLPFPMSCVFSTLSSSPILSLLLLPQCCSCHQPARSICCSVKAFADNTNAITPTPIFPCVPSDHYHPQTPIFLSKLQDHTPHLQSATVRHPSEQPFPLPRSQGYPTLLRNCRPLCASLSPLEVWNSSSP